MKKQLIIASVALLLGTIACKKNETTTPPIQNQGLETSVPANELKQKMFGLPSEQITVAVKSLKGTIIMS